MSKHMIGTASLVEDCWQWIYEYANIAKTTTKMMLIQCWCRYLNISVSK